MANQSVTEKLRELAETVGVSTGFWDWYGNWKHVEDASLIAVLNSLGFSLSFDPSEAEINEAFRRNEDFAWAACAVRAMKQKFLSMFLTEWACGATLRPKMDITMNLSS